MTDSVRSRFIFTVGANLFRSLLRFTTGMLVARWLEPEVFGRMAFLLGTFLAVRVMLDMGSGAAFFTFLSQERQSRRFVRTFFAWLGVQFLIPLGVIALLFPSEWVDTIWQGEQLDLVLLAFGATFMQHSVWPVIVDAGESQRRTIRVQAVGVAVSLVHLLAVVLLWWLGILGLYAIFAAIALEYLIAAVVAHRRLQYALEDSAGPIDGAKTNAFRRYVDYCLPLIPLRVMGFAYIFFDRWLLQNFGGGVQQAYYAVGSQFASIGLLATSSILRIFWKEVAEAHKSGDHERTRRLYHKVTRLLFLSAAIIAGFLIPWAEDLLRLILGAAYVGGATTLAIMFIYPVHQSMGQIVGTMLYATERIRLQVLTGMVFMTVSIGVTYLVLAPSDAAVPGLAMASEGLALKMVGMQFIQVNAVAYIISRIWNWPFDWVHQPVSLLGCIGLGWAAHYVVAGMFGDNLAVPFGMGLAGAIYAILIAAFVYALPWTADMTRGEITDSVRRAWHIVTGFAR